MNIWLMFCLGICVGAGFVVSLSRRYRNRDGKLAEIVRRVTGATKE